MAGYTEEEYYKSQDTTPFDPPKGSADWAEQNSGDNAPGLKPSPDPSPGTLEAHEQQQTVTSATGDTVATSSHQPNDAGGPATSTDTEHTTSALSPEQQQRVDATAGTDRQIRTIKDWMEAEENRPETQEERKKRERREKSKRIIAAVSDGISALGNLFFTTQYAPNMYNPEKGMTTAVDKRLEQLKAERERKRDQYMNYALTLGNLENQRAATLRELEAQQERMRLAHERAQREAEAHGWMAALQQDKQREQKGKADRAAQEAIAAQAEAEAAPELQQAKIATEKARKGSLDASASNSRASAAAHGRSNVSEFSAWDEKRHEHKFRTKEAADAFAKQHGTWREENVSETTNTETRRTPTAQPQSRTSTKTKKSGYPAKSVSGNNTPRRDNKWSNTSQIKW